MKKFFMNVPLQPKGGLRKNVYYADEKSRLYMKEETSFPIFCAIHGYVQPGEAFRLIAVEAKAATAPHNTQILREELEELCQRQGILCPAGVEVVEGPPDGQVGSNLDTFQRLIDYVEDGDELFGCITYGYKSMSMALLMAMRYAYRLKQDVSISCVVYGERDHVNNRQAVYDETALVQMDEILRLLAERGVENPRNVLDSILSL